MRWRWLITSTFVHGTVLSGTALLTLHAFAADRREPATISIAPSVPSIPAPREVPDLERPRVEDPPPVDVLPEPELRPPDVAFVPPELEFAPPAEESSWLELAAVTIRPPEAEPVEPPAKPAPESTFVEAIAHQSTNLAPPYPPGAIRRNQAGEVMLRVRIDADGDVLEVELLEPFRYPILDRAAVRAAQKWTFGPARRDGIPVASHKDIPVVFRLER